MTCLCKECICVGYMKDELVSSVGASYAYIEFSTIMFINMHYAFHLGTIINNVMRRTKAESTPRCC
jgi:hypothetical protein